MIERKCQRVELFSIRLNPDADTTERSGAAERLRPPRVDRAADRPGPGPGPAKPLQAEAVSGAASLADGQPAWDDALGRQALLQVSQLASPAPGLKEQASAGPQPRRRRRAPPCVATGSAPPAF
ncbi:hypothetical protein LTR94_029253, partial [Friedmanniomyces endolithicus]